MLVSTAVQNVIDQLDVGEGRYPLVVGTLHVNQAMVDMSREYQFPYDNTVTTYNLLESENPDGDGDEYARYPGSALVRSVLRDDFLIPDFIFGAWLDPSDKNVQLVEPEFNTMMREVGDQVGDPQGFCLWGDRIWWRPIPAIGEVHQIRFSWKGFPRSFSGNEEPVWLIWAPYAVIYKACEIASQWLLEDERVPGFQALRREQMQNIDVTNSMRGDSYPTAAEEPG